MRKKTSKLVKGILQHPERVEYTPTEAEARKWFKIINQEVFSSVLEYPVFEIRRRHGLWGECISYEKKDGYRYTLLSFNNRMLSKSHFIAVVAHETIHHWQWTFLKTELTHGPTFWQWKPKLAKFGIKLEYKQDHN